MKIPKSLKLPRKLKKEVKKGITRNNVHKSPMKFSNDIGEVSAIGFYTTTYKGSNTKAFFRLCKYVRRLENLLLKKLQFIEIKKETDKENAVYAWNYM